MVKVNSNSASTSNFPVQKWNPHPSGSEKELMRKLKLRKMKSLAKRFTVVCHRTRTHSGLVPALLFLPFPVLPLINELFLKSFRKMVEGI
ncbi:uncharacterized protein LOC144313908 isoform X5 [Canis aureus]